MEIAVCVGSSCHIRGSYAVIEKLREAVARYGLEDEVALRAAFCLGRCTGGVSIQVDGEIISGMSVDNFDEVFARAVLQRMGKHA